MKRSHHHKIRGSLIVLILLCSTVVGTALAHELPRSKSQVISAKITQKPVPTSQDWLIAVNAERSKVGVKPLVELEALDQSSAEKATELAQEGWNQANVHANSAGVIDGPEMGLKRLPQCSYVSENLAKTSDLEIGMSSLMASPSHRAAILDPRYEFIGTTSLPGFTAMHFADCTP